MAHRLDQWLVDNDYFPSPEKARLAIERGLVYLNDAPATNPAQQVGSIDEVTIRHAPLPDVHPGGLPLARAIKAFDLKLRGRRVLDISVAPGESADCALLHGAARVYTVAIGSHPLSPSLKKDERISWYEGLNIRDLTLPHLDHQTVDLVVVALSSTSLTQVLPLLPPLLAPKGEIVTLVRPRFELPERNDQQKTVIREEALRQQALNRVLTCAEKLGFRRRGLAETGKDQPGSDRVEFLLWLKAED